MKKCNKCEIVKELQEFEALKAGKYVRPTCRRCYNEGRRSTHGGEQRDSTKRKTQLDAIISEIEGCELLEVYKSSHTSWDVYRIRLSYKGFEWDIRRGSFVSGMRPWVNFRHSKFKGKKCVYRFDDANGRILYVGKSSKIAQRMSKHFSNYEIKTLGQAWKKDVEKVFLIPFDSYADMHIAEMYLINKLKPAHNKDSAEYDGTSFTFDLPDFEEFWVRAVYDKTD